MPSQLFSQALSLLISVGGNLALSWLFLRALLSPVDYVEFIKNTSIFIFLIEFLSLHSGAFALGFANQEKPPEERDPRIKFYSSVKMGSWSGEMSPLKTKIILITVYSVGVFGVGLATGNWALPMIFFISLLAKFFGRRASDASGAHRFAISILLLISLTMLTTVLTTFWTAFFPFPSEARPPGSGTWVDYPQDLIAWGFLYYLALAIIEIAFYARVENNIVWRPFYYIGVFFLKILTVFLKLHPQSKKLGGTINFMQKAEKEGLNKFLESVSGDQNKSAEKSIQEISRTDRPKTFR